MHGLAAILGSLIFMAEILVIARVVISWLSADPSNRLVQFIVGSTEPLLTPIRRRIPIIGGGIDLSPIVLLFGLLFLKYALVDSLRVYANSMLMSARIPVQTM
ncbi:YggT family protein [bacterium]|nr:YggT family protein [bacterium]